MWTHAGIFFLRNIVAVGGEQDEGSRTCLWCDILLSENVAHVRDFDSDSLDVSGKNFNHLKLQWSIFFMQTIVKMAS